MGHPKATAPEAADGGLCRLLRGSLDCLCGPHTSVPRPSATRSPFGPGGADMKPVKRSGGLITLRLSEG